MEKSLILRDNQEAQAGDFNNLQSWMQDSLDHVVLDAIEGGQAYSGMLIAKTASQQVTVAAGRYYSAGKVYALDTPVVIDMLNILPIVTRRVVTIVCWGIEQDTDVQSRKFLINPTTMQSQPRPVPMEHDRLAQIDKVAGDESLQPSAPNVGSGVLMLGTVTLDPTGVVSISQVTSTQVENLRILSIRTGALESWQQVVNNALASLSSAFTAINNRLSSFTLLSDFQNLVAQFKALYDHVYTVTTSISGGYLFCDDDDCLDSNKSDLPFPGFDCRIEEGFRFPLTGAGSCLFTLLNPTRADLIIENGLHHCGLRDQVRFVSIPGQYIWPAIQQHQLGAPIFVEERLLSYSYRTFTARMLDHTRRRYRCGSQYLRNPDASVWWYEAQNDPTTHILSFPTETWETSQWRDVMNHQEGDPDWPRHSFTRGDNYWEDCVEDSYWSKISSNIDHAGQFGVQVFTAQQDFWFTTARLPFSRAGNYAITALLCNVTNGVPDFNNVIARVSMDSAGAAAATEFLQPTNSPIAEQCIRFDFPFTHLRAGRQYAIVFISSGDFYFYMLPGYLRDAISGDLPAGFQPLAQLGTYYSSSDVAPYFIADAQKRILWVELSAARFPASVFYLECQPITLGGGILAFDWLGKAIVPDGCRLGFEFQINGVWCPADFAPRSPPFSTVAATLPFRIVYYGTGLLMPAICLTTMQCNLCGPRKTDMHHYVKQVDLGSATALHVNAVLKVSKWNAAHHTIAVKLLVGDTNTVKTYDAVADITLADGDLQRTWTFNFGTPIQKYRVVTDTHSDGTGEPPFVAHLHHHAN